MIMPVPVRLSAGDQMVDTVLEGESRWAVHQVRTSFRPDRVQLDPRRVTLDWNAFNDGWSRSLLGSAAYRTSFDNPLGALPVSRDRAALRLFPLLWANDAGGVVGGLQLRTSYLTGYRQGLIRIGLPAVDALDKGTDGTDPGSVYAWLHNPILFGRPRLGMTVEGFAGEGRAFLRLAGERDVSARPTEGPRRSVRASVVMGALYDPDYAVPGRWSPEAHQFMEAGFGTGRRGGIWQVDADGSVGLDTQERLYFRGEVGATGRFRARSGAGAEVRLYAGGVVGHLAGDWRSELAPRERQLFLAGADPFRSLGNPWLRSAGAPLADAGHEPGGASLQGYDRGLSFGQLVGLSGAVSTRALPVEELGGLQLRGRLFGGVALGPKPYGVGAPDVLTPDVRDGLDAWSHPYASAGLGVELGLRRSPVRIRVDLPVLVADPELASMARDGSFGLRYSITLLGYR
jgi:hypothetical protein